MKDFNQKFSDLIQKLNRAAADIKDWALENKSVSVPAGVGIVALIVICIIVGVNRGGNGSQSAMQGSETASEAGSTEGKIPVPEVPLEENAYPEINALFANYYEALANGEVETVEQLRSYLSESDKLTIEKRSEYIDYYADLTCYTKPGPMEDSYIVYTYYEAKLYDYETKAPSVNAFLVCRNDAGNYWIKVGEIDQNMDDYITDISLQEDVAELYNRADVKYAEAMDADPELEVFLGELQTLVKSYAAEEIAKREAAVIEETEAPTEEETQTEETEPEAEPSVTRIVAATDVVNIRSSDSETADRIAKAQIGDRFTLLENLGNGWSKIQYEGRDAYIKTEYLEVVDEQTADAPQTDAPESSASSASNVQPGGTVTAKTTVNVRASASESGERLGTIYQGEKLEVIMPQADGWTKVVYQGKTGYVKSEFVE